MRRGHFDALRPLCPRCLVERQVESPLDLAVVVSEDEGDVREGVLHCSDRSCYLEYPILDGIPLLVPGIRAYVSDHFLHLTARDDLSELVESLLGDGAGPGSAFDTTRQHLSSYGWGAYADLDPEEPASQPAPGASVRCLERGLGLLGPPLEGPAIDIGCSVGRTSFALAERTDGLVLGVDLNFSMLRLARRVLTSGTVSYPRRRLGIVYDRREFPARFPGAPRVDFWACDALALPFAAGAFGAAVALNVLDCVGSPRDLLESLSTRVRPGGSVLLSTPYDWSPAATPVEAWIGGHSQRGPDAGQGEPFLRTLLTFGAHPQSVRGLEITGEVERHPWHVRLHERSGVDYEVHLVAAEAVASP